MQPGSLVVYLEDPLLYGKMIIVEVAADGRLLCESVHRDASGEFPRESFGAHEIEYAAKWHEAVKTTE